MVTLKFLREDQLTGRIALLTGTRPGVIKMSPVIHELDRRGIDYLLLHSGQHYSPEMDAIFFSDLAVRAPDYRLEETRNAMLHGEQTAEMLRGIERILLQERPWVLLVGGDCNSHIAGALAARKLRVRVAHLESGLRAYDWRVPEEHNRRMIDHISEYLFVHNDLARERLERESVPGEIFVVGTTITDAVRRHQAIAESESRVIERLGLTPDGYFAATCHREENVDDGERLRDVLTGLIRVARTYGLPVVFPAHPRTQLRIKDFGLTGLLDGEPLLRVIEPLGYLDFLRLLANARLLLTDSGGGQQEACILRVPCVTLRDSYEWTETVEVGANLAAGVTPEGIQSATDRMMASPRDWENPFGDGRAAGRVADVLERVRAGVMS